MMVELMNVTADVIQEVNGLFLGFGVWLRLAVY